MSKIIYIFFQCCIDKNSDTYLSLSLNMLLKKITKKYQHKAEKIIHRYSYLFKVWIVAILIVFDNLYFLDFYNFILYIQTFFIGIYLEEKNKLPFSV